MLLETTPPAPPGVTEIADFISGQPLGVAILLIGYILWLRGTIARGKELEDQRALTALERERADKLQATVDTLSAGLNQATDALRQFADSEKVSVSLMQGIDNALRQRGDRR